MRGLVCFVFFASSLLCSLRERGFAKDVCAPCISLCCVLFIVSSLISGHCMRASYFAAARVNCSGLYAEPSTMGDPYPKMEEFLDYEEEEGASPNVVAAKTNSETIKK